MLGHARLDQEGSRRRWLTGACRTVSLFVEPADRVFRMNVRLAAHQILVPLFLEQTALSIGADVPWRRRTVGCR